MSKTTENRFEKKPINKILTFLGISMLFLSIFLLYAYSILNFLHSITTDNAGPAQIFNKQAISNFLLNIKFNDPDWGLLVRYLILLSTIALILIALFTLTFNNLLIRKHDLSTESNIIVIHDDILEATPKIKEDGTVDYQPETLVKNEDIMPLKNIFVRKGPFGFFLKLTNIFFLVAAGGLAFIFWYDPPNFPDPYLYTDEARLISNIAMVFFNLYFLLRCPDFLKSFAFMAFKRVNLGGSKFRMHETFLGILLALAGIMMIVNSGGTGTQYFEIMCSVPPLILGTFLIGRDWKDFAQGKFISD
jgi:hypothetical protein